MTSGDPRSRLVNAFMTAEANGAIMEWCYSYSPEGTLADTRYLFRDASGTMKTLSHRNAGIFLSTLDLD